MRKTSWGHFLNAEFRIQNSEFRIKKLLILLHKCSLPPALCLTLTNNSIAKTLAVLTMPLAPQFWGENSEKVPRAPLTPQFWGELEDASLFFSGDARGRKRSEYQSTRLMCTR